MNNPHESCAGLAVSSRQPTGEPRFFEKLVSGKGFPSRTIAGGGLKKGRFTGEQIAHVLPKTEAGVPPAHLVRQKQSLPLGFRL